MDFKITMKLSSGKEIPLTAAEFDEIKEAFKEVEYVPTYPWTTEEWKPWAGHPWITWSTTGNPDSIITYSTCFNCDFDKNAK